MNAFRARIKELGSDYIELIYNCMKQSPKMIALHVKVKLNIQNLYQCKFVEIFDGSSLA
jgi:hypothetical protein